MMLPKSWIGENCLLFEGLLQSWWATIDEFRPDTAAGHQDENKWHRGIVACLEIPALVGYSPHESAGRNSGNSRNGKSRKTLTPLLICWAYSHQSSHLSRDRRFKMVALAQAPNGLPSMKMTRSPSSMLKQYVFAWYFSPFMMKKSSLCEISIS